MSRERAVSDVVAAVILILIVVAIFGGVVSPLLMRYQSSSSSVLSAQQKAELEAGVLISPIYAYSTSSNTYVYFYNYGKVPFTPAKVFVNGQAVSFTLIDQQSGVTVSSFEPNTVTELEISGAYTSPFNISVVGNGITLSWTA